MKAYLKRRGVLFLAARMPNVSWDLAQACTSVLDNCWRSVRLKPLPWLYANAGRSLDGEAKWSTRSLILRTLETLPVKIT
jgi:hypothetical protein